jgi:hypothetical protein
MPDIRFYCPKCKGRLVVDTKVMGKKVPCPKCKETITIPLRGDIDDEENFPQAAQTQSAGPIDPSANQCTHCGKKLLLSTYEVTNACREAGIPLTWGNSGPSLSMEASTATGLNDIHDILTRIATEKVGTFQTIIGSWAPKGRCATCGEIWCQQCIKGPLPHSSMGHKPSCKCG